MPTVLPPPPYFWAAGLSLAGGSIVEPGNWGRVMRRQQWSHGNVVVGTARELGLELIRREVAPNAPSRLDCAFAFLKGNGARQFLASTPGRTDVVYEVELVEPDAPHLIADLSEFGALIQQPTGLEFAAVATRYWAGTASTNPNAELLTLSPLRVLRRAT